jgi:hypothetical protein
MGDLFMVHISRMKNDSAYKKIFMAALMTFLFAHFFVHSIQINFKLTEILCHGERADAQICARQSGDA